MQHLPWILALATLTVVLPLLTFWLTRSRMRNRPAPLPGDWALTARPVFTTDERRVYRLLREALPHHVVLSKLPLVRFCQPADATQTRYWYDLLGSIHVSFAVCSANGRVLAAIDLANERTNSPRVVTIKQSVLSACRVRYLRSPSSHLPTVAELQLLVPQTAPSQPAPHARSVPPHFTPHQELSQARDTLSTTVATRRAERSALWQDSSMFQDSFFAPDSRLDHLASTDFGGLLEQPEPATGHRPEPDEPNAIRRAPCRDDDTAGVVVDPPARYGNLRSPRP